ncbi:hypothetical protein HDE_11111 [Halotydeus destructor]|nr:hypothetical protein HDE_11111 [Halotydeus destructor]
MSGQLRNGTKRRRLSVHFSDSDQETSGTYRIKDRHIITSESESGSEIEVINDYSSRKKKTRAYYDRKRRPRQSPSFLKYTEAVVDEAPVTDDYFVVPDDYVEYEDETPKRSLKPKRVRPDARTSRILKQNEEDTDDDDQSSRLKSNARKAESNSNKSKKQSRRLVFDSSSDSDSLPNTSRKYETKKQPSLSEHDSLADDSDQRAVEEDSDKEVRRAKQNESTSHYSKITDAVEKPGATITEVNDSDDSESEGEAFDTAGAYNEADDDSHTCSLLERYFVKKIRRLRQTEQVASIYYVYAGQIVRAKHKYKADVLIVGNKYGIIYDNDNDIYVREGHSEPFNSDVFLSWLERISKKLAANSRLVLDSSLCNEINLQNSHCPDQNIMTSHICDWLKHYKWSLILNNQERIETKKKFYDYFRTVQTPLVTASMLKETLTVHQMRELIQEMYIEKSVADQICKENGVKILRQPPSSEGLNFIHHVIKHVQGSTRYDVADSECLATAIKSQIKHISRDSGLLGQLFKDLQNEEQAVLDK